MYQLSDQQIDFILDDIQIHGIRIGSLQQNLLDHICILIEQNLEENGDFEKYYSSAIRTFYKEDLREIEEETVFLLEHRGPHVLLSRSQFFLALFTVVLGPFIAFGLLAWLVKSREAGGPGIPVEAWSVMLVYSLFPLLILLVLLLTPDRFDPLIPKRSKVLLGIRPFIKIIHADSAYAG
ncbi:MAG TPA: hypothetical protein VK563_20975 [Puia sp.]|nr:hypothetical protein [Puia sp.]